MEDIEGEVGVRAGEHIPQRGQKDRGDGAAEALQGEHIQREKMEKRRKESGYGQDGRFYDEYWGTTGVKHGCGQEGKFYEQSNFGDEDWRAADVKRGYGQTSKFYNEDWRAAEVEWRRYDQKKNHYKEDWRTADVKWGRHRQSKFYGNGWVTAEAEWEHGLKGNDNEEETRRGESAANEEIASRAMKATSEDPARASSRSTQVSRRDCLGYCAGNRAEGCESRGVMALRALGSVRGLRCARPDRRPTHMLVGVCPPRRLDPRQSPREFGSVPHAVAWELAAGGDDGGVVGGRAARGTRSAAGGRRFEVETRLEGTC